MRSGAIVNNNNLRARAPIERTMNLQITVVIDLG
jgi:hypothetical protein